MNGVGTAGSSRRDDRLSDGIALLRRRRADRYHLVGEGDVQRSSIRLRMYRNGRKTERAAASDDAAGDLAAIGDEDLAQGQASHLPAQWSSRAIASCTACATATAPGVSEWTQTQ